MLPQCAKDCRFREAKTFISAKNSTLLPIWISPMNNPPVHAFPTRDRRPDALGDLKLLPDELICAILEYLSPRDVARLSCVSSVMYILCNEEPLWMILCVRRLDGPLKYKGSWKKTTLCLESAPNEYQEQHGKSVEFDGFNSLFLYRRLYRCHTTLNGFAFHDGNVDRKANISLEEFNCQYDGKKPVLLSGLADTWRARKTWTIEHLSQEYGDTAFRISQRSPKRILMKFKDYVSYMNLQHDEDPLYIFDDKFGETAPSLLKDFSVPYLFQEDFFEVLDRDDRPPFRWLIIGPERSGASWHVDPALTSAWNTLLCGRKRWALYPPGRVPLGVTVHVNDEDGDVNIDTPSSLQWWLDFYPHLADEDTPIECIQQPGETIFVPSGWWHCVLNLEPTVAVTQNFVNRKNFEYVCLDMAPGYRHKGVCRAGLLALDGDSFQNAQMNKVYNEDVPSYPDLTRKEKRIKMQNPREVSGHETTINDSPKSYDLVKPDFYYDIEFLSTLLHEERDHYNSPWSSGNCIGPREMRGWLSRLWVEKPGMRDLIWKGACLALNAERWLGCLTEICSYHNLPCPSDDERLPVGTGSNPVYLVAGFAVKIFVEGGLEASMYNLGTELEFYSMLCKSSSSLKNHVPEVVATGILYLENGTLRIVPWDGKGVPNVICDCNLILNCNEGGFPFDVWRKKHLEYKKAGLPFEEQFKSSVCAPICPFIITKRCKGKIFAELRDTLSWEEAVNLASFLGKQLHNLHVLPYPPFDQPNLTDIERKKEMPFADVVVDDNCCKADIPEEWRIFVSILSMRRKNLISCLTNWGDPIPKSLIEKVDVYLPDDFTKLFVRYENDGLNKLYKDCSWIHTDIMDDNVYMEPQIGSSCSNGNAAVTCLVECGSTNGCVDGSKKSWHPSYIIDFSDLSIGDRIYDIIPIYLDIFRGDSSLLKQFLESYKLPLIRRNKGFIEDGDKYNRLSYHTMCYCILHDENILGAIFSLWKELRTANSWEEVELSVWGELNNYQYSS